MQFFSFFGSEYFFLFVAPALIWLVSPGLGLRVGLLMMTGSSINASLKLAFHSPRPYWIDPAVQPLSAEPSFGFPSGHSMNAVLIWGYLAAQTRRKLIWLGAAVLIFLIGLSRLALGVHYTADVLGGWLFGAALLGLSLFIEPRLIELLKKRTLAERILLALAASFLLILVGALIRLSLADWTLPPEWVELGNRGDAIDPLVISGLFTSSGAFFGLAAGAALSAWRGGFNVKGAPVQLAGRLVIGLVGIVVIYFGLKAIFPEGENLTAYLLRYVRYSLIGLWAAGLAPLIFVRLKLANRGEIIDVH
jgi:membrane-associated phospholipid phosphatase